MRPDRNQVGLHSFDRCPVCLLDARRIAPGIMSLSFFRPPTEMKTVKLRASTKVNEERGVRRAISTKEDMKKTRFVVKLTKKRQLPVISDRNWRQCKQDVELLEPYFLRPTMCEQHIAGEQVRITRLLRRTRTRTFQSVGRTSDCRACCQLGTASRVADSVTFVRTTGATVSDTIGDITDR